MLASFASCNSESDNIPPKPEENQQEINGNDFTINISIKVIDSEGNNLLDAPGEFRDGYYNEQNISINNVTNSGDRRLFSISNNDSNETLLNITVTGEYNGSFPVQKMTIKWGTTWMSTTDLFTFDLEKTEGIVQCKKIWINSESKWENENPDFPIFTIVKEKCISNLHPAEPISLKYPEKVRSENQFAFNLFKKAILDDSMNGKENTFVSPLSVNLALNMLVNGAEGETKEEIIKALESQNFSIDQINEHSKELSNALPFVDPGTSLSIANSVWPSFELPIKEAFIHANINYYDAEVNPIDFTSYNAINVINKWCADKTRNMIPKALNELSEDVMLLLINALYFKSNWSKGYEFNEHQTKKEPFHAANGLKEEVDMMHNTGTYLYKSNSYAGYLKIPFGNNAYDMVLILPNEDKTMQDVIDNIDFDPSWTTSDNMEHNLVNLSLPKFKLDFSYEMQKFILPEMGMTIPFTEDADFSKISNVNLFVTKVIHKTAIDVNEHGAAAAAITIIIGDVTASGDDEERPKPKNFNVNRPFIFSICEKSTGTILFIGKIDKILK